MLLRRATGATELGFDGASGCHAKHFPSLRLEFCDALKEVSNDRKNPIGVQRGDEL
jgi:hypothetical protein